MQVSYTIISKKYFKQSSNQWNTYIEPVRCANRCCSCTTTSQMCYCCFLPQIVRHCPMGSSVLLWVAHCHTLCIWGLSHCTAYILHTQTWTALGQQSRSALQQNVFRNFGLRNMQRDYRRCYLCYALFYYLQAAYRSAEKSSLSWCFPHWISVSLRFCFIIRLRSFVSLSTY